MSKDKGKMAMFAPSHDIKLRLWKLPELEKVQLNFRIHSMPPAEDPGGEAIDLDETSLAVRLMKSRGEGRVIRGKPVVPRALDDCGWSAWFEKTLAKPVGKP